MSETRADMRVTILAITTILTEKHAEAVRRRQDTWPLHEEAAEKLLDLFEATRRSPTSISKG